MEGKFCCIVYKARTGVVLSERCIYYTWCWKHKNVCVCIDTDVLLSEILQDCLRLAALSEFLATADCQATRAVAVLNDLCQKPQIPFLFKCLVLVSRGELVSPCVHPGAGCRERFRELAPPARGGFGLGCGLISRPASVLLRCGSQLSFWALPGRIVAPLQPIELRALVQALGAALLALGRFSWLGVNH